MSDQGGRKVSRRAPTRRIVIASVIQGALLLVLLLVVLRTGETPRESAPPPNKSAARGPLGPVDPADRPDLRIPIQSIVGMLAASVDNSGGVEICGLGKIKVDRNDPFGVAKTVSALGQKAQARWRSALLDSDDSRARAVGLLIQATPGFAGFGGAEPAAAGADQARDALVQLAVGAADPAVYAMAVHLCNTYEDPAPSGSCQRISLPEWASIDADNAVPWLYIAGKARAANDTAAAAVALGRAAAAHKTDSYNSSLLAYAQPELPADATPFEQYLLAESMIGYEAAWFSPQYNVATGLCSAQSVSDEDVRQNCDALAELFVSSGTTLIDLGIGASIGSRVGWPGGRLRQLSRERNALMQVLMDPMVHGSTEPWDCNNVRVGSELLKQIVRLGELGAARDALERSGETIEELAQRQAEFMEKIRGEAQQRREQDEAAASTAP